MELNYILMIVGLIICFLSIYFIKIFAGIVGFIWGFLAGLLVGLIYAGSLYAFTDEYFYMALVIAIVAAILSIIYFRICAALNAFFCVFFMTFLLLTALPIMMAFETVIVLALVAAFLMAALSYIYYKYAFIAITAFSGAYLASLGITALTDSQPVSDFIIELISGNSTEISLVYLLTIIIGCLGFLYQSRALESGKASPIKEENPSVSDDKKGNYLKRGKWSYNRLNKKQNIGFIDTLKNNWIFLLFPVITSVMIPLYWQNQYSFPWFMFQVMPYVAQILSGITLGVFLFLTLTKNPKFVLLYSTIHLIGRVIQFAAGGYFENFFYRYNIMETLFYIILYGILILAIKYIPNDSIKPLLIWVLALIYEIILFPLLASSYVYIDGMAIMRWLLVLASEFLCLHREYQFK